MGTSFGPREVDPDVRKKQKISSSEHISSMFGSADASATSGQFLMSMVGILGKGLSATEDSNDGSYMIALDPALVMRSKTMLAFVMIWLNG